MKNKVPGRNVNFLADSYLNRNGIIFSEKIDSQIRQALSCRKSILNGADSFWGVDNYRLEWYHKKRKNIFQQFLSHRHYKKERRFIIWRNM